MKEKGVNYKPEYAKYFDHTKLYPEATTETIKLFCEQALEYEFAAVCVNPCHVKMTASLLKGSNVKTATVVGFPLGANTTNMKAAETKEAVENGAQEIDMVINIGAVKDDNWDYVEKDITAIIEAAGNADVKVIIETHALTDEEKVKVCKLAEKCGAKFVKTCSGFYGTGGATVEDVALMRKSVSENVLVKASTGIRTREDVDKLLAAGAVRFGSSAGPKVVDGD
ncbi:MAG: deoxyribose-phosphate aldolase [Lachnospiraceae bacterium]|nr:deoxyribose-phosphate aldolase [Lachnospiraceae bacterium]